jgi:ketosteroid isomerase-like protein
VSRERPVDQAVVDEVLATNRAFYSALEAGDLDAVREIWVPGPDSVCVHPGTAPIHGTAAVLRSWAMVMASMSYVQFFLTEVEVSVSGEPPEVAAVTLSENILVAGETTPQAQFQGAHARAVNVFTRTDGRWRLWLHQAAPVLSGES